MSYILYTKLPGGKPNRAKAVISASCWLKKKTAVLHVKTMIASEPDLKWMLMDFSARGGWCDGNTSDEMDFLRLSFVRDDCGIAWGGYYFR